MFNTFLYNKIKKHLTILFLSAIISLSKGDKKMLEIKNPNKKQLKAYNSMNRSSCIMPKSYLFKDRHEKREKENNKELYRIRREYI